MKNLCSSCKWAKWDLDSVANAYCDQLPVYKGIDNASGYVIECSSYKSNNIISCIINFVKKNDN